MYLKWRTGTHNHNDSLVAASNINGANLVRYMTLRFVCILGSVVASGRETATVTPGRYFVRVHFGM